MSSNPNSRQISPLRFRPASCRQRFLAFSAVLTLVMPPGLGCQSDPAPTTSVALYSSDVPTILPGSGGVTDQGASSYAIPIKLPDGPNGWKPSLAIDYNGSARWFGRLGVGWGLAGTSQIEPCHQVWAQRGYADGPSFGRNEAGLPSDFENDNVYCLDGVALAPDPLGHWTNGDDETFRTEVESFKRIVAKNATDGRQPTEFLVEHPDGSVAQYMPFGHSDTSITYLITRHEDRNGNRILYSWELNTESESADEYSYRIGEIDYAFDRSGNPSPRAKVQFQYGRRAQATVQWRWGVKVVERAVLDQIVVFAMPEYNPDQPQAGITPIWRYHLDYDVSADTGRDLLARVWMTDVDWAKSFERSFTYTKSGQTTFSTVPTDPKDEYEYEIDRRAMGADADAFDAWLNQDLNRPWIFSTNSKLLLFDADGDGDDDALYRTRWSGVDPSRFPYHAMNPDGIVPGKIKMRFSQGGAPLSKVHDATPQFEFGLLTAAADTVDLHNYSFVDLGKTRVADLNRDGINDLLLSRTRVEEDQTWRVLSCDQDAQQCGCPNAPSWPACADAVHYFQRWTYGTTEYLGYLNNGNTTDPYVSSYNQGMSHIPLTGAMWSGVNSQNEFLFRTPKHQTVIADFDGDGLPDRMAPFLNIDVSRPPPENVPIDATTSPAVGYWQSRWAADAPNFLLHPGGNQVVDCGNGHTTPFDVDGDGRDDVLTVDADGSYRRLSYLDKSYTALNSTAYLDNMAVGGCSGFTHDVVFGDWNGDGTTDMLYPPTPIDNRVLVRWNTGEKYGPLEPVTVTTTEAGNPAPNAAALLQQVPTDRLNQVVPWDRGTRVADIDGDGRSDIIAFRPDSCDVSPDQDFPPYCNNSVFRYRWAGDHFIGETVWWTNRGAIVIPDGMVFSQLGDVTGDGAVDVVTPHMGNLAVIETKWREQVDLLQFVNDSSTQARFEEFTYSREWDGKRAEGMALNSDQDGCSWPTACVRGGMTVVRAHKRFASSNEAGVPKFLTTYHRYTKPRTSLTGRGFLGFHTHEMFERERGGYTKRVFDPDRAVVQGATTFYPYASHPIDVIRVVPTYEQPTAAVLDGDSTFPGLTDGGAYPVVTTWTHDEYSFPLHTMGGGSWSPNWILRPERTLRVSTEIDETARFSATQLRFAVADQIGTGRKISTVSDYDDYGNVISETSDIADAATGVVASTTVTTALNFDPQFNGVTRWMPQLARTIKTRTFMPGGPAPINHVTTRTFDPNGDLKTEALGYGTTVDTTTTYTHDAFGNALTASSTDGTQTRVTQTKWDPVGIYPTERTDPLGFTTKTTIHPWFGTTTRFENLLGKSTNIQHDGFGRVRYISSAGQPSITRTYSWVGAGQKIDEVRSDGVKYFKRFDEAGRLVESGTSGFGSHPWIYTRTLYDRVGNLVQEMTPSFVEDSGTWTTMTYDRLGRMMKRTTPDHDAGGVPRVTQVAHKVLRTTTTDPNGHISFVIRDAANRPVKTGSTVAGAEKYLMAFQYGLFDQLAKTIDPIGKITTVETNLETRTVNEITSETGLTTATMNGFGEVKRKRYQNGDQVDHTYDVGGRIKTTIAPEGTTTRTYDVDPNDRGQLSWMLSPDGVRTDLDYDGYGRLSIAKQTVGTAVDELRYRYDNVGRIRYLFYPVAELQERLVIRYDYGVSDGQLREVRNVSGCGIDPNFVTQPSGCDGTLLMRIDDRDVRDQLVKASYGNGFTAVSETRSYGETGRLVSQMTQRGATTDTTTYAYDGDGQLASRTEGLRVEEYAYDPLHRLQVWRFKPPKTGASFAETVYRYDDTGNLTDVKIGATTSFSASYDAARPHRISSSTAVSSYSYDTRGRQTSAGARNVAFTSFDLPRTITINQGTKTFKYDGFGRRASQVTTIGSNVPVRLTRYFGDVFEFRGNTTNIFHVFANGERIAQIDASEEGVQTRYAIDDHRDTPNMWAATGFAEKQYFDPYGQRIDKDGVAISDADRTTTVGFTGHEDDDNAGLVNMGGRIYDRVQYRFLTPDPLASRPWFSETYNPYSYVQNDPLNMTDPSGLQEQPAGPSEPQPPTDPYAPIDVTVHGERPIREPREPQTRVNSDDVRAGTGRIGLCYVPGREPYRAPKPFAAEEEPEPAKFWSPDLRRRDPRHQARAYLGRGGTERVLEASALGLGVTLAVNPITAREVALLMAADLAEKFGVNPGVVAAAAVVLPKRWLKTPTLAMRGKVFQRQKGQCIYCGIEMTRKAGPRQMHLDHPNPFDKHGPIHPLKSVGACRTCNLDKGNRYLDEFFEGWR